MYGRFAHIYDELMDDVDYEAWFKYILEIYRREGLEPETVLEMAAGTGNLSSYLAGAGFDLTCFDLSSEMLAVLDRKLAGQKKVRILRQDMTDFSLGQKYDSVLCICDSLNYVTEDGAIEKVFKNVYNHLEEGGLFIFDINSAYKLREVLGENTFIEDREDIFYAWENFQLEDAIVELYINFFVRSGETGFERFTEQHYERIYELEEILAGLKAAGFSNISYYKAFSFDPVDAGTERINFVIKK